MSTLDTRSSCTGEVQQQVGKAAQQIGQQTQRLSEQAGQSLRSGYRQSQQMVRQQPIESVLVCFAAGLIGGFCLATMLRSLR